MTEQNVAVEDPIKAHWDAIGQSLSMLKGRMDRAKKDPNKPLTVGALAVILEGDVLPFMQRTVELQAQLRDGTAAALQALEERVDAMSDPTTTILPEDGAVFRVLVQAVRDLVSVVRSGAGANAEVTAKLAEYEEAATRAEAILDDSTLEADEDDEGEGDEAEGE